jgi:hypothetical protein
MFECCMLNKQDEFRVLHEPMGEFDRASTFDHRVIMMVIDGQTFGDHERRRCVLLWTGEDLEPVFQGRM